MIGRIFGAALLLASLLPATANAAPAAPLPVVASFTILADMVRQIGGTHVHVISLVGPDSDPHAFEPTPNDAKSLKAASLIFVNGLGLEGWMDRLITASGTSARIVVASTGVPPVSFIHNGRRTEDPHAWNSAANGEIYVARITHALQLADPANAAAYAESGARYIATLQTLDSYAHTQIQAVPEQNRRVLTSHDSFGYFGAAYGVTFLSPVGFSTESEASALDVARLIRAIKLAHIRCYFFENSNDPRLVAQIAAAAGVQPGGRLYVESLSAPGGPAASYTAMFRRNVDLLVAAMQGKQSFLEKKDQKTSIR